MVVGIGKIKLKLFDVRSLKAKRKIVRPMIGRIQSRFNISICESGLNDSRDWAEIGFAVIGNDARRVNSKLDKVIALADDMGLAMIADSSIEIMHC